MYMQSKQHRAARLSTADWTGNLGTGSVVLTDVNEEVAAEGTADKIAEITKLSLKQENFRYSISQHSQLTVRK